MHSTTLHRTFQWVILYCFAVLLVTLVLPSTTWAQPAPTIVSVTPTNGAINVATNSSIVIVFDQEMKTSTFPFKSQLGYIGNFDIQPTNLPNVSGSWNMTDKKTLTLTPGTTGWPYASNIVWTLNPPTNGGTLLFPQFAGTNGIVVPTVSGSFTVAPKPPPQPKLAFVFPTNNATEVLPNTAMIFVFDQDMDTSVPIQCSTQSFNGNYSFYLPSAITNGFWSDKRTITFLSATQINLGTYFTWYLNPVGATIPFRNTFGNPVAPTNGNFTIITSTGGNANEICPPAGATTNGEFLFFKTLQPERQTGPGILAPVPNTTASFVVTVTSPPNGSKIQPKFSTDEITNGSLTFPDKSVVVLTNLPIIGRGATGPLGIYDTNTTDIALEANYPPGSYSLNLGQFGQPGSEVPMTLPVSPTHPLIQNFTQAQQIDAGQDFILNWNSLAPDAGAFVSLTITDAFGKLIFAAPNPCVPRTLDAAATSILIPANTFKGGLSYLGTLQFGYNFHRSTNAVPHMEGNGSVWQTTSFSLKTVGGYGAITVPPPGTLSAAILTNHHPQFVIHGIAGRNYVVRRTGNLTNPAWTTVGNITLNGAGNFVFEDTDALLQFPVFYEVLGGN